MIMVYANSAPVRVHYSHTIQKELFSSLTCVAVKQVVWSNHRIWDVKVEQLFYKTQSEIPKEVIKKPPKARQLTDEENQGSGWGMGEIIVFQTEKRVCVKALWPGNCSTCTSSGVKKLQRHHYGKVLALTYKRLAQGEQKALLMSSSHCEATKSWSLSTTVPRKQTRALFSQLDWRSWHYVWFSHDHPRCWH